LKDGLTSMAKLGGPYATVDAPRVYNERTRKYEYAFFADRNVRFVEAIGKFLEKEAFEKDDFIIREGDKGHNMYFICSGRATLCTGAYFREVQSLIRGAHCGEMALFGVSHRTYSVIACEHTECLVLKNRFFKAVVERFPEEKEYFERLASAKKQELKMQLQGRKYKHVGKQVGYRGIETEGDSDRDATDDPAPKLPEADTTSPLPDAEIPGQLPPDLHLSITKLCAPPQRQGPAQLAPLGQEPDGRVRNGRRNLQQRMGKELKSVGHAAFVRKMEVAAALHEDMLPDTSSSMIPLQKPERSHSLVQVPSEMPKPKQVPKALADLPEIPQRRVKSKGPASSISKVDIEFDKPASKAVHEDDDDDRFDFINMDLNAIDPWGRATSA